MLHHRRHGEVHVECEFCHWFYGKDEMLDSQEHSPMYSVFLCEAFQRPRARNCFSWPSRRAVREQSLCFTLLLLNIFWMWRISCEWNDPRPPHGWFPWPNELWFHWATLTTLDVRNFSRATPLLRYFQHEKIRLQLYWDMLILIYFQALQQSGMPEQQGNEWTERSSS